jgi:hypothetical protein
MNRIELQSMAVYIVGNAITRSFFASRVRNYGVVATQLLLTIVVLLEFQVLPQK